MANKPKMWPSSETRLFMPQATEEQKANLTATRGRQAADIKDPEEKKKYIAGSANVDKDYQGTAEETAGEGKKLQTQAILGSMKKGGTIPKTGLYKLHKDEKVVPADKAKTMAKKSMDHATDGLAAAPKAKRSKKAIHLSIEPTDNKGFIVKHTEHTDGMPGKTKHHVFQHAAEMHKHVMKTFPAKAMPAQEPMEAEAAPEAPAAPPAAAPVMPQQA
jgi:hypothetical protein